MKVQAQLNAVKIASARKAKMRNMSFSITTEQMRKGTKSVTRRFGWWNLKAGDVVMACVKCMGLKKGQKVERLYPIEIISTRKEMVLDVTSDEVEREGFPNMSTIDFMFLLCNGSGKTFHDMVNRIEFRRLK